MVVDIQKDSAIQIYKLKNFQIVNSMLDEMK